MDSVYRPRRFPSKPRSYRRPKNGKRHPYVESVVEQSADQRKALEDFYKSL